MVRRKKSGLSFPSGRALIAEWLHSQYLLCGWTGESDTGGFGYWKNSSGTNLACGWTRTDQNNIIYSIWYPSGEVMDTGYYWSSPGDAETVKKHISSTLEQFCSQAHPSEWSSSFCSFMGLGI